MSTVTEAIEVLEQYGYTLAGDRYVQIGRRTQEWQATDTGFLRFDPEGPMPLRVLTNEELKPVNKARALADKDWLNPLLHNYADLDQHDLFIWEWPADEVVRIYGHAVTQKAAGWPDERTEEDKAAALAPPADEDTDA